MVAQQNLAPYSNHFIISHSSEGSGVQGMAADSFVSEDVDLGHLVMFN